MLQAEDSGISFSDNEQLSTANSSVSKDSNAIWSLVDGSVLDAFTVSNIHFVRNIGCMVASYRAARPKRSACIWLRFIFHRCNNNSVNMVEYGNTSSRVKDHLNLLK